ncbi:S8 family serine peptidase [Paenibacillus glycinis]|uniref:S8 family serine peptidase n=1 Tax=Paenibacillus glycinis TaxID=2697035 RepID=A0ABW9XK76_9BACL|nr:S8 family serine peptidase [Paenibacillus glycinis]NBD23008.1 S8 family serine peptidase [Paenibacillus glycinis]
MKQVQAAERNQEESMDPDMNAEPQEPPTSGGQLEYAGLLPELPEYAPDQVIVKYKSEASSRVNSVSAQITGSSPLPVPNAELLQLGEDADVPNVIEELLKDPNVLYAEPNYMVPNALGPQTSRRMDESAQASTSAAISSDSADTADGRVPQFPNDPLFNEQWGLHNTGQALKDGTVPGGTPDMDMDLPEAWGITKGSGNITIAIIGGGAKIDVSDLDGQIWENKGEIPDNGVDDDGNGLIDDLNGWDFANGDHSLFDTSDSYSDAYGTVAAGQIAAKWNNDEGIAGVAPDVKVMPLKVMTKKGGRYTDIVEAIHYAEENRVKIAMFSFVYTYKSRYVEEAINASRMLFVAPSGDRINNNILNIDVNPVYPASYASPNLLTVSGANILGNPSDLAAIGKESIDVSAPSELIASTNLGIDFGYAAQIDNPGKYKAFFSSIGFEEIPDDQPEYAAQRQDMFNLSMDYLKEGMKDENGDAIPTVLLVNDSVRDNGGGGVSGSDSGIGIPGESPDQQIYEQLLTNANYAYDTFTTESMTADGPSLSKLQGYDIVIWFTGAAGDRDSDVLVNAKDQANLTAYLNGHGHLLLTGQNSLDAIADSNFAIDVLGVQIAGEGGWISKGWGVPGTIFDGQTYRLPDVSLYIDTIVSSKPEMTTINLKNSSGDYAYAQGTIFAAAYAAGVAGLVQSVYPDMSALDVKQRIMTSGKTMPRTNYSFSATGKFISAYRALWNKDIPGMSLIDPSISNKLDSKQDPNHVYAIELHAGEEVTLSLTGDAGTDFDLVLYDPSATTVAGKEGAVAYSEKPGTSAESITYRAAQSGTYYINVFAVAGAGQYTLNVDNGNSSVVLEDSDPSLTYEGDWQTVTGADYSNGSIKQLTGQGSVKFGFRGNLFEWIGATNENQGNAEVYIDGIQAGFVNLYSKQPKFRQSLFRQVLANGHHAVEIRTISYGEEKFWAFNVDAFKVSSFLSPTAKSSTQAGPWVIQYDAKYADGSQLYTTTPGSYSEYPFHGTKVTLWSSRGNNRGKVNVMIDGRSVTPAPIDLYSEKPQDQVPVFTSGDLSDGQHTIRIMHAGDANPKSSNRMVTIEGLEIENLK